MEKSYNIIAVELLGLFRCGYGLEQGCAKAQINMSELAICMRENTELNAIVCRRFDITVDKLENCPTMPTDDEIALREKARRLGIKYAGTMGVAKLKQAIEAAECPPASGVDNDPPANNDGSDSDGGNENNGGEELPITTDAPDPELENCPTMPTDDEIDANKGSDNSAEV